MRAGIFRNTFTKILLLKPTSCTSLPPVFSHNLHNMLNISVWHEVTLNLILNVTLLMYQQFVRKFSAIYFNPGLCSHLHLKMHLIEPFQEKFCLTLHLNTNANGNRNLTAFFHQGSILLYDMKNMLGSYLNVPFKMNIWLLF